METSAMIREQFKEAHNLLETTMQEVTAEQAHWAPPGIANPLGATFGHVVMGEDMMVGALLKGAAPLLASSWAGKTGLSEPPPAPNEASWDEWARKVKVDVGAAREYAKAVYAATDEYLASLDGNGLEREIDLSAFQLGKQTAGWFLCNIVLSHVNMHCGEISCLKGLQGAKGYPF